jgi:diguanylate cyclase (GGDEF)-like protein/PAS domain S-box-containing protein
MVPMAARRSKEPLRGKSLESVSFYRKILEKLHVGVIFVDKDRRITYVNARVLLLTGYEEHELLGTGCWELFRPLSHDGSYLADDDRCPILSCWSNGGGDKLETFFHHRIGHLIPVEVRVTAVNSPDVAAMVEISNGGISRLEDLHLLPLQDHLTGLANRFYLESSIETRRAELNRYGWPFGVLFIDIDGFKEVNDTYGHGTGDLILIAIGTTLLNCMRSSDVVGRWGGDEFLAILPNVGLAELFEVAERYRLLVQETTLPLRAQKLHITVSVGGALATAEDTLDSVVARADFHMYASKAKGKNCVTIDSKEGDERVCGRGTQPMLFSLA